MPLDPVFRSIIEQFSKQKPDMSRITPEEFRKLMNTLLSISPREDVYKVKDTVVKGSQAEIPIRLYYPSERPNGILVYFHGGGWVIGDIESYDPLCRAIAKSCNCIVASVGYRLAPEHKFPAAVIDSFDSLKWVSENAEEIGSKKELIAVGGDSAGGNLAAVVSILARDNNIPLKYQVLIYPAVGIDATSYSMIEYRWGFFLEADIMNWFLRNYINSVNDMLDPRFSPILADDLKGLPPALVITAEYDPLRDQGEAYASRLRNAGVPVISVRFNGVIHGFLSFFGISGAGRAAIELIGSVLKRTFKS
ncbi:MAG: alpha/beta hydrolase [Sulfolobaceae archaeon]